MEPLTDHADRFAAGATLRLDGEPRTVEWSRWRPDHVVVKLSGLDDREQARERQGMYLEVPAEDRREAGPDAWYHEQLLGLAVETESGRSLGRIEDVLERPANDVWVARGGGGEVLIPASRDAVRRVDLEGGRVVVADWLLQVEEA